MLLQAAVSLPGVPPNTDSDNSLEGLASRDTGRTTAGGLGADVMWEGELSDCESGQGRREGLGLPAGEADLHA
jgi:hypothetical protein